ncbi:hypothetical protein [Rhizobium sp. YTU87027]|uniref:hypothetical protein n=1 Tax=Rhizobium sp. YTU87027 TaxID=3417741 RepID=UPI003D681F8B
MKFLKQLYLLLTEEIESDPQGIGQQTVAMGGHGTGFWPHRTERERQLPKEATSDRLDVQIHMPNQFAL